jgi:putative cardiolipin synthase
MLKSPFSRVQLTGALWLAILSGISLAPSAASADQIQYLAGSAEAYERLVNEVDNAQHSIDMTYFIFNPSSAINKIFVQKLIAKEKSGVHVRILLDANPQPEAQQFALSEYLEHNGIEVKFYRIGNQYNPMNNMRSHAKLFLVDGSRYITGGRNIEDDYYGLSDWMNYIDREVWVHGPTAEKAQKDFNRQWNSPHSTIAHGHAAGQEKMISQWKSFDKKTTALAAVLLKRAAKHPTQTPIIDCADTQFTFDDESFLDAAGDSAPTSDSYMSNARLLKKETTGAVIDILMSAEKFILMENYSYLPMGGLQEAFNRARDKKIPLHLVTNRDVEKESYAQSIQNIAIKRDSYGTEEIMQLSRHGAIKDAWALRPAKTAFWTIHGKIFVIDHKTSFVGSFNIDPRSYNTNLETGVVARNCPKLAQIIESGTESLETVFEKDKSCEKCQQPTRDNGVYKSFLGWIGYGFI